MTYEALGNNVYKLTLTIFRDCESAMFTPIPNQDVKITVFNGDTIYYTAPSQSSITMNYYPHNSTELPVNPSNGCLIPPLTVCMEKVVYETNLHLPYDSLGYHIAYQRCCRDPSLPTLNNPDLTGITLSTFISEKAQQVGNSSPIFNENFSPIMCANELNIIDASATDLNGDSLVYTFCAPFLGASPFFPKPDTASHPPFQEVAYSNGFSATQPIMGNISINSQTGLIHATPNAIREFIIGICTASRSKTKAFIAASQAIKNVFKHFNHQTVGQRTILIGHILLFFK